MEYCLGNGLELLSALKVFAVCHDSSVFQSNTVIAFVDNTSVIEVNGVVVFPRMVSNIGALCIILQISLMFLFSGLKTSSSFSYIVP